MPKQSKGSDFERELCRKLSRWWTNGERDDVFWRTSQSGGRATERSKKSLKTFGSYGDVMTVDPIGQPLTTFFTIELKRGSSYSTLGDLLDFKPINSRHPWVICLMQAIKSHRQACSIAWLMICRRDHRLPIVYLEVRILRMLCEMPIVTYSNTMRMTLHIQSEDEKIDSMTIIGLPLGAFLEAVKPKQIIRRLNET